MENDEFAYPQHQGLLVQPNCEGCPLQGEKIVCPEGNPTADIVLVGEYPSYSDVSDGKIFTGQPGALLNEYINKAGGVREQFWITNAVLCKPKSLLVNNEMLDPDTVNRIAIDHCRSRLIGELQAINPKVVVGLGAAALRALMGSKFTMKGRRGGIHYIDLEHFCGG